MPKAMDVLPTLATRSGFVTTMITQMYHTLENLVLKMQKNRYIFLYLTELLVRSISLFPLPSYFCDPSTFSHFPPSSPFSASPSSPRSPSIFSPPSNCGLSQPPSKDDHEEIVQHNLYSRYYYFTDNTRVLSQVHNKHSIT